MNPFPSNIKYLRARKGLTQAEMAKELALNRTAIGAYEDGRAEPKLQVLRKIATLFDVSIDDMLHLDLSLGALASKPNEDSLRILPVSIDQSTGEELIPLIPEKAAAGYTKGYSDAEYIESLPHFSLPLPELDKNRTYRSFQIEGESMLPIVSGSYIICEYLEDWRRIKSGECYILITHDEGIVFKRVEPNLKERKLLLISDNSEYEAYEIELSQVLEVWQARGVISFNLEQNLNPLLKQAQALNESLGEFLKASSPKPHASS